MNAIVMIAHSKFHQDEAREREPSVCPYCRSSALLIPCGTNFWCVQCGNVATERVRCPVCEGIYDG